VIAPPDGRTQIEKCPAMRSGARWVIECLTRLADLTPRQRTQERRQGIGGKPTDSTPRNEVCFMSQSVTSPDRAAAPPKAARRNLFDTSALFARHERNFSQAVRALR
jgi:hypothetical protein